MFRSILISLVGAAVALLVFSAFDGFMRGCGESIVDVALSARCRIGFVITSRAYGVATPELLPIVLPQLGAIFFSTAAVIFVPLWVWHRRKNKKQVSIP